MREPGGTRDDVGAALAAHLVARPHEYVALDMDRVVEALDRLEPVEEFLRIARTVAERDPPTRA